MAKLFPTLYGYHIKPTLVVTSPLRRCLQTTELAFGPMIRSGELCAIAHPGLQEVSNDPCDTGTPLDVLRDEFPDIEFRDDLFSLDAWPRDRSVPLRKAGTIYDDESSLLEARAVEFRKWLQARVDDEVIVVTHGGFVHFLWDRWHGHPGSSSSSGENLFNGEAVPVTLSDASFHEANEDCQPQPHYPGMKRVELEDYKGVPRDCGMFTADRLR
jgi:broad specificity phosphatase PhoE